MAALAGDLLIALVVSDAFCRHGREPKIERGDRRLANQIVATDTLRQDRPAVGHEVKLGTADGPVGIGGGGIGCVVCDESEVRNGESRRTGVGRANPEGASSHTWVK